MPTFGSLFSGLGGIDLGLERAGWEPRWQVEIEPFPLDILERRWPDIPRYGDIRAIDWTTVEPVDLIVGGFPCQPVSQAGRRRAQSDATPGGMPQEFRISANFNVTSELILAGFITHVFPVARQAPVLM